MKASTVKRTLGWALRLLLLVVGAFLIAMSLPILIVFGGWQALSALVVGCVFAAIGSW